MENSRIKIEDVFKTSGVPTYTFEEPAEFKELVIAVRTAGRGVVVEGPSGIGKTTAVKRAIEFCGMSGKVCELSGRRREDLAFIESIIGDKKAGVVIVDDFHRLSESVFTRRSQAAGRSNGEA